MRNPYIVTFSDRLNFTSNLLPVHSYLHRHPEFESSLVGLKEKRIWGARGKYRAGPFCEGLLRKPDAFILNHAWWDEGYHVCQWAQRARIPVVAIEHGCTMFHQEPARYRSSIGLAQRKCLWSQHNLEVMMQYNPDNRKRCVITGPPKYDELHDFHPIEMDLPEDYILVLSTWSVQKDLPRHAANQISEFANVVMKVHPNETHYPGRKPERIVNSQVQLVYDQEALFTLLYRASAVVCTISSAMIPALLFEKPIFLVNQEQQGMDVAGFKRAHGDLFRWVDPNNITEETLSWAVEPDKNNYEHFGGPNDGKNVERIIEVVRSVM